jgi:hypothetical protein
MEKALVSLRLTGDSKLPAQLFAELGVHPDKTWRKGDPRGGTTLVEQENGCEFRAHPSGASLEEQADSLLRRLGPIAEKIHELQCEHVQLTCIVYAAQVPAIHFSRSTLEKLSHLGASLDVDLYIAEGNWTE